MYGSSHNGTGSVAGGTTNYVCIPEGRGGDDSALDTSTTTSDDVAAQAPEGHKLSTCGRAYRAIGELTSAWAEWHPDREAKAPPSRVEFLAVCNDLGPRQQMCLLLPYARDYRPGCEKMLGQLPAAVTGRLDGLFLNSE